MSEVSWSYDIDAHCCIQTEIGYFTSPRKGWGVGVVGESHEECAQKLLKQVISNCQSEGFEHNGVQIRFFWFKDPVNYKGVHEGKYEFDELRQLIIKHEWAKHVGTWVNANTGNKMDGWMLVIPVEKDEDYDNDF